jgi:hypothetical protein
MMHRSLSALVVLAIAALRLRAGGLEPALREEGFDREPSGWEGINNRSTHFEPRTVVQDFGWSPGTNHAGGRRGEIGGRINPAGEAAYYALPLPRPLSLESALAAEGTMLVARGSTHVLVGFFNAGTLNEWRTPNAVVARINARGDIFHGHVEYCTSRWRAGAGVIGEIVPGERIQAKEIPCGTVCAWKLAYDPAGAGGGGSLNFTLDGETARCDLDPGHRADGATFTHFGLLPVLKSWDTAGEVWLDDVIVNGAAFDFGEDPKWAGRGNRRTYVTANIRPRFDFGWSPSHHAGGAKPGELGGLIFRGDCREPHRMACYGARLVPLTLETPLEARGKIAMLRGVTDSTASIGFYNAMSSMQTNPSQQQSIPMDYLGINIEGPSSEGFFFYPVYRIHGDGAKALGGGGSRAPRIYPDGKSHDWFLAYDPDGAGGRGRIVVGLDGATCALDLDSGHKDADATFDRFGICTPWIDGNSVTAYFDDLTFTCAPPQ